MSQMNGYVPTTTRRNLLTILRNAAQERDVSLMDMEQRFSETFAANRESVGTVSGMASAISAVLDLPITASHVGTWMKRYEQTIPPKGSAPSGEVAQLRAQVAALTEENERLNAIQLGLIEHVRAAHSAFGQWLGTLDAQDATIA